MFCAFSIKEENAFLYLLHASRHTYHSFSGFNPPQMCGGKSGNGAGLLPSTVESELIVYGLSMHDLLSHKH
jgi:hypothetical protein